MVDRDFKVGVFEEERSKRKTRLSAYTVWYNPNWKGCCEHTVTAESGTEAKRMAMTEHREHCMEKKP